MNMDEHIEFPPREIVPNAPYGYVLAGEVQDEINLADLIRNLAREWKIMAILLLVGTLGSIAYASFSTKIYLVEAMLRAPTFHELGDVSGQNLVEIEPVDAFTRFTEQILAPENHHQTLVSSDLLQQFSQDGQSTDVEISSGIYNSFSLEIVKHDYYQLSKGEKAPFKEISISMESGDPELAQRYLHALIKNSENNTVKSFAEDFRIVKENRVKAVKEEMEALAQAEKQNREAKIARLEEANRELIIKLQQQIDLNVRKTKQDRENQIIQLEEALKTAAVLNIEEPVTWDDLRPLRKSSQVTNEIGDKDESAPLYFRGTRLLKAELDLLNAREDDRPFISDISDLENQIIQAQNDPVIIALKSRQNDLFYVEKHDDLQRQLSGLLEQPAQFENTQFVIVSRPATIPPGPIRSPMLIVAIGVLVSGFLALFVALIFASFRNSDQQKAEV